MTPCQALDVRPSLGDFPPPSCKTSHWGPHSACGPIRESFHKPITPPHLLGCRFSTDIKSSFVNENSLNFPPKNNSVRKMALFYIFANLFRVWPKQKRRIPASASAFDPSRAMWRLENSTLVKTRERPVCQRSSDSRLSLHYTVVSVQEGGNAVLHQPPPSAARRAAC